MLFRCRRFAVDVLRAVFQQPLFYNLFCCCCFAVVVSLLTFWNAWFWSCFVSNVFLTSHAASCFVSYPLWLLGTHEINDNKEMTQIIMMQSRTPTPAAAINSVHCRVLLFPLICSTAVFLNLIHRRLHQFNPMPSSHCHAAPVTNYILCYNCWFNPPLLLAVCSTAGIDFIHRFRCQFTLPPLSSNTSIGVIVNSTHRRHYQLETQFYQ